METLLQDVRLGVRLLRKDLAFTAVVIAVIALGVGANTALFSLLNATLFRPLPLDRPAELVTFFTVDGRNPGRLPNSHRNIADYRDRSTSFAAITAFAAAPIRLQAGSGSDEALALIVTGDYFSALGVRPALGRTFVPDEDRTPGARPVAVISYGLWQRRFAADPAIAGKSVTINRLPFTIVGVAPRGFTGVTLGTNADAWVPMMMYQALPTGYDWYNSRRGLFLGAVGRLKPGVDRRQAQADLDAVSRQLQKDYPVENDQRGVTLLPLLDARLDPNGSRTIYVAVALLYTVVGIVLLIGCANVANLLLVRGTARRREIATRLALGAPRTRLIRQLLTESFILAAISGAAGVLLAYWTMSAAAAQLNVVDKSYLLDARVLTFALAVSLAAAVVFGLAPALHASRPDVMGIIKGDGAPAERRPWRFSMRQALFVAQVALSLVALVGSGLFIRSLQKAATADPGFETNTILLVDVDLAREGYNEAAGRAFQDQLLARVSALPGVAGAALAQTPPFAGGLFRTVFLDGKATGPARDGVVVQTNVVGPRYFATLGIPVVAGRDLGERDGGPAAVVVNETMAKRFWPAEDAIGKRFRFFGDARPQEVVGIVRDTKYNSLTETPQPFIYRALTQNYAPAVTLHVRAARSPREVAAPLRAAVLELDRNLPVAGLRTLRMQIDATLRPQRIAAALLALFGLLALALATIGIYGLMSYAVLQRTRELGIRVALGAPPRAILRLVLLDGMRLAAIGVVIGIAVAFVASRALTAVLFGVSAADPVTFVTTSLVLATVAIGGCYLPARRGTKVDPMLALRPR